MVRQSQIDEDEKRQFQAGNRTGGQPVHGLSDDTCLVMLLKTVADPTADAQVPMGDQRGLG